MKSEEGESTLSQLVNILEVASSTQEVPSACLEGTLQYDFIVYPVALRHLKV